MLQNWTPELVRTHNPQTDQINNFPPSLTQLCYVLWWSPGPCSASNAHTQIKQVPASTEPYPDSFPNDFSGKQGSAACASTPQPFGCNLNLLIPHFHNCGSSQGRLNTCPTAGVESVFEIPVPETLPKHNNRAELIRAQAYLLPHADMESSWKLYQRQRGAVKRSIKESVHTCVLIWGKKEAWSFSLN